MKTKLKIGVALVMAAGFLAGISNFHSHEISPLALANVEALSDNQVVVKNCPGDGKDLCDAILHGTTLYIFTYIE